MGKRDNEQAKLFPEASLTPTAPPATHGSTTTVDDLASLAEFAAGKYATVRDKIYAPDRRKVAPVFTANNVAELCGLDAVGFARLAAKNPEMPQGTVINRARREFSLAEVRRWTRFSRRCHVRAEGERAFVLTVALFKGGVAKTSTVVSLGQALSTMGYRVLVLDLDPQGSATTLLGFNPDSEIGEDDTILPYLMGSTESLRPVIRNTYWDGLDLIPGAAGLFGGEFHLPARQMRERGGQFRFWEVLRTGLSADGIDAEYDVILIDTPPAMSYVTMNAFYAGDGVLVPVPPAGLDFSSSVQFLGLLANLLQEIEGTAARVDEAAKARDPALPGFQPKTFRFFNFLMTKVDAQEPQTALVQDWIRSTFGHRVLPVEIPMSNVVSTSGAMFSTLYDLTKYNGAKQTFLRAREAYNSMVSLLERQIRLSWPSAAANASQAPRTDAQTKRRALAA